MKVDENGVKQGQSRQFDGGCVASVLNDLSLCLYLTAVCINVLGCLLVLLEWILSTGGLENGPVMPCCLVESEGETGRGMLMLIGRVS